MDINICQYGQPDFWWQTGFQSRIWAMATNETTEWVRPNAVRFGINFMNEQF
jgi:hypothetical protein